VTTEVVRGASPSSTPVYTFEKGAKDGSLLLPEEI
jgi:hypothetical protein